MHKSEDFTMEEIQMTLRIEEEARKRMSKNFNHEGVNFVKGGPSKKPNKSNANTSSKRKFVSSNNSGGGQKSAGGSGGQKSGAEKPKFPLNKHFMFVASQDTLQRTATSAGMVQKR